MNYLSMMKSSYFFSITVLEHAHENGIVIDIFKVEVKAPIKVNILRSRKPLRMMFFFLNLVHCFVVCF